MPTHSALGRTITLLYGLVCYAVFLVTFLYAIGFVGNLWPVLGWSGPSMDAGGPVAPLAEALAIDTLLLAVFALQHSGMARTGFKRWWTRIVPEAAERSTYVLAASLCLALLFWQWRPIGTTVFWDVAGTPAEHVLFGLSLAGWFLVLLATFMLSHFDLFGLRQVWLAFRGREYPELRFATPGLYRAVRHPIYLGFLVAFWATPLMTLGHLVFAIATTAYVLVAIQLEEHDLVHRYGDLYRVYRRRVGMLLPRRSRREPQARESAEHPAGWESLP
jgi:protein-S-isoprenylcysteine O-methyltransferase Ste14